ncbi:hypothetical protein F7725_005893 [Dissostichus mawsoni]|uniref:Tetratricopeptide repeat protein 39B n=1 Tax=Dissostichus mawsoni TaxID=36200 RepID=A0A7J5YWQ8_DISMA|nr:hypothetical protein F7725_005893 [Dissostichus mawsoni]
MDLEAALKESSAALDLFLNNRFSDALALLKPRKNQSMYHAMGYTSILVMQAGMTFDPKDMDNAMASLRESLETCQKDCQAMASATKGMEKQSSTHIHFRGGVNMGIGSFNLMLSLLPSKVLRLMEFLGFSGNRELGLSELREGAAGDSLRSILSTLTLLMFHLYITVILGTGEGNLTEAESLLEPYIDRFPNGALILFYTGRIALLKGNFTFVSTGPGEVPGMHRSTAGVASIHHLCYWELMWAYTFEQKWREAYRYADLLCKESKWSQAVYTFQKAAILSMMPEEEVTGLGENVEDLFRQVDGLRLRIAGKSIPTEKFAANKAQRYFSSDPQKLVVPALEMMYVWNGFTVVGKRPELTKSILTILEKAEEQLRDDPNPSAYHLDDQCVVQLLKGLCLRELENLVQAELCFNHVISSKNNIKHDNYLVPFTMYELGLLHKQKGDTNTAINLMEDIKMNYKDYHMESRLHFRIHAALNTMGSFAAKLPPSRTPA